MADQLFDTGQVSGPGPETPPADAPLAVRMRPRSLDEVIGQEHVLGEGSALRTAIESGKPHSAILYGPPGAEGLAGDGPAAGPRVGNFTADPPAAARLYVVDLLRVSAPPAG